jgi:hypothetical protein
VSTSIFALSTGTTILVLVAVLLVVAVVMTAVAVWLVRSTRRDAPALGPLEVMADRSWRRADADRRQTMLTDARPDGALPPAPTLADEPDDEPEIETAAEVDDEAAVEADDEVTVDVDVEEIEVEVLHRYHPVDG